MRFRLRTLFAAIAVFAVLIAILASEVTTWQHIGAVTLAVEALNGAINDDYPPTSLFFSVAGLPPRLTDEKLEDIAPQLRWLPKLQKVSLTATQITDRGVKALLEHSGATLWEIDLDGTRISDDTLKRLASCPKLERLSIPVDVLTDGGIRSLSDMKSLRYLFVFNAEKGDERVDRLKKSKPHLNIEVFQRPTLLSI